MVQGCGDDIAMRCNQGGEGFGLRLSRLAVEGERRERRWKGGQEEGEGVSEAHGRKGGEREGLGRKKKEYRSGCGRWRWKWTAWWEMTVRRERCVEYGE